MDRSSFSLCVRPLGTTTMLITSFLVVLPLMTSLLSTSIANTVFRQGSGDGNEERDLKQNGGRTRKTNGRVDEDGQFVAFVRKTNMLESRKTNKVYRPNVQTWELWQLIAEPPTIHNDPLMNPELQRHANDVLGGFQEELRHRKHVMATAEWNFLTNLTDWNSEQLTAEQSIFSDWWRTKVDNLRRLGSETFPGTMNRQIGMALTVSLTSNNDVNTGEISRLESELTNTYSSAKVCLHGAMQGECLSLDPGLLEVMASSRDPDLLKEAWLKWRRVTRGARAKRHYSNLVGLLNTVARENGYRDYSQFEKQQAFFETPELERLKARLWVEIAPLYQQLHAYVRRRLREAYGDGVVGNDGSIPAHLLGNMWAQNWREIYDMVAPYPEVDAFGDVDVMLSSHSDAGWMFPLAEEFYKSLGLPPMTHAFWSKSIFTKPKDRSFDCNARSFDMFHHDDFRIKSCAKPDFRGLLVAFHELGHIAYCMAYAHQPTVFRTGANLATHEAIGDMVQVAFLSTAPLVDATVRRGEGEEEEDGVNYRGDEDEGEGRVEGGIVESQQDGKGSNAALTNEQKGAMNRLMMLALEKVAFLPFGYLVDEWRVRVMEGRILPGDYNQEWWELRLQYQGVKSPTPRSKTDFDPGAKYHVIANSMFSGYFLAQFQQFQMLSALCQDSELPHDIRGFSNLWGGHSGHGCNIFQSRNVTQRLRRFLSHGSSIPWQDQLKELTGEDTVTSQAMLTYFHPLHQWLEKENTKRGETVGWGGATINWRH